MSADLETRLRELLADKAATIPDDVATASQTGARSNPPELFAYVLPVGNTPARRPAAALRVAAALALVVVAAAVISRANSRTTDRPPPAAEVTTAASTGQAWPLTADQPLPANAVPGDLATPETVASAYLRDVVGHSDWPLEDVSVTGSQAVVRYILQDVPAEIHVTQGSEGLWYVTSASSDLLRPGGPVLTDRGIDVPIGPGPRTYESGSPVRVAAMAADGRSLATATLRVPAPRTGAAAAAPIASLTWADPELPASVRADVLDDIDGNPATPDVVIGHWTVAIANPVPQGLPVGFDLAGAEPVFTEQGSADDVAESYLRSRFPDYPAPGVTAERARTRTGRAYVTWSTQGEHEQLANGVLVLRQQDTRWHVLVATTGGVDLTGVRLVDNRLQGLIRSANVNALFADVLTEDGNPVPDSPRPEGFPGAAYRYGSAAGPGERQLSLDIAVTTPAPTLRLHLVGGTILSITELRIQPAP